MGSGQIVEGGPFPWVSSQSLLPPQIDRQALAPFILEGEENEALSIAAVSLTASMQPSSCIFLLPIRSADQLFRSGSRSISGAGGGSPS